MGYPAGSFSRIGGTENSAAFRIAWFYKGSVHIFKFFPLNEELDRFSHREEIKFLNNQVSFARAIRPGIDKK